MERGHGCLDAGYDQLKTALNLQLKKYHGDEVSVR